jgi:hypothetical protein
MGTRISNTATRDGALTEVLYQAMEAQRFLRRRGSHIIKLSLYQAMEAHRVVRR